jgi:hypothetical protein
MGWKLDVSTRDSTVIKDLVKETDMKAKEFFFSNSGKQIPLMNLDDLLMQLTHGEMKLSLMEDMSVSRVIIREDSKGCDKPLFAMIQNDHFSENFIEENI